MAKTSWKRLRLFVDIVVKDDSLSEKDFRWAVAGDLRQDQVAVRIVSGAGFQGAPFGAEWSNKYPSSPLFINEGEGPWI